jgi:hypothetical protein
MTEARHREYGIDACSVATGTLIASKECVARIADYLSRQRGR